MLLGPELQCLAANDAMRRDENLGEVAIEGKPVWELLPDLDHTQFARRARQAMAEGQSVVMTLPRHRDGHTRTGHCHPCAPGLLFVMRIGRAAPEAVSSLPMSTEEMAGLALLGFSGGFWEVRLDPERPGELPDLMYISPSQKRLIGFEGSEFPNSYRAWQERILPDDRHELEARSRQLLLGRESELECEYRIRHRDGSIRWILSRGDVQRDEKGRPIRWTGVALDYTEHRAQEHTRGELAAIVDASDAAIISCSPDGTINTWNSGAERVYGYAAQEVIGQPYAMLLPPTGDAPPRFMRRLAEGGRYQQFEAPRRRKDGTLIDVTICMSPIYDREGRHVASSLIEHDITQRRNMQEALRESEARFRGIFYQAAVGIAQLNLAGDIEFVNERMCQILDRKRDNLLGRPLREIIHAGDPFRPDGQLHNMRQAKASSFSREIRCVGRPGAWANMTVNVVEKAGRVPAAFIVILEDITQRKETEEDLKQALAELRALNQNLEARIEERTRSLVRNQDLLRELLAQLNDAEQKERHRLASQLHDYLPQILVAAKMKLARVGRLMQAPRGSELLDEVNRNLDEALHYSRTLVSELSPTVLYEFGLQAAMPALAERMKEFGLQVAIQTSGQPAPLPESLAAFLFQSIRELLYNVAKHAQTRNATVRLKWMGERLAIDVIDRGSGFDPQDLPARQLSRGSFGLLNIEQRLETLGGNMQIQSSPKRGTTMSLQIPLHKEADAVPPQDAALSEAKKPLATETIRVIIADDQEIARLGLRAMLEAWHDLAVVGEAKDGAEALALTLARNPEVVLMDADMPGMDGLEAARRIAEQTPEVAIIGLYASDRPEAAQAMRQAGAACCVSKETSAADLRAAILARKADRPGSASAEKGKQRT